VSGKMNSSSVKNPATPGFVRLCESLQVTEFAGLVDVEADNLAN
jgi:hypothetical protein